MVYDRGILGDDKTLANAIWRRFFNCRPYRTPISWRCLSGTCEEQWANWTKHLWISYSWRRTSNGCHSRISGWRCEWTVNIAFAMSGKCRHRHLVKPLCYHVRRQVWLYAWTVLPYVIVVTVCPTLRGYSSTAAIAGTRQQQCICVHCVYKAWREVLTWRVTCVNTGQTFKTSFSSG